MRPKLLVLMVLLVLTGLLAACSYNYESRNRRLQDQDRKWAHEERMAKIKTGQLTRKEQEEFAEMVADKVVERLENGEIGEGHSD
jgi:major membrane immunogen (membrane-anchored lipoprotein)